MFQYLMTEFKKLNNEVPDIHFGGCTVFAEALYHLLIKLGKQPKIVFITSTPNDLIHAIKLGSDDTGYFVSVTHAVIEVDGKYLDNNGIYDKTTDINNCENVNLDIIYLTLEDLQVVNKAFKYWNTRFDRSKIGVIIEKLNNIEKHLELSE